MSSKQFYPFFNLTGYRGIIVKKFTAHYARRNTDLNLRLVTDSFFKYSIHGTLDLPRL